MARKRRSPALKLRPLEDRVTPTGDPFFPDDGGYADDYYDDPGFYDDGDYFDPFAEFGSADGWDDTEYTQLDPSEWFPLGADAGGPADAVLLSADGGEQLRVSAYDSAFTGGVRVAAGDVNGDGVPDLIAAPGPGMPVRVKVYDGRTGGVIHDFLAFEEGFTGGAFVASADVNRDGVAEVIVSPDEGGGPRVRVLDGATLGTLQDFYGIDDANFRGGCRVAVGDVNADFTTDLVVSAGFGGGPRIAVFDGQGLLSGNPGRLMPDFFAFEDTLRNGAYPAVGDLNDDGFGDLVFGSGPGGGPRVLALDGYKALDDAFVPLGNFFAGNPDDREGVQVGIGSGGTGQAGILAAPRGGETAGRFNLTGQSLGSYNPFQQSAGGSTVGSTPASTRTTTAAASSGSSGRRAEDDAAFHHGIVASNFRGNYTAEYNTTIWDEQGPAGKEQKVVRVEVVLTVSSVTPQEPNGDPAKSDGGNYSWTGTMVVRPAGYRSMTVQVKGVYTCSQFPTTFKEQLGTTNIYTQGSAGYRTRPDVSATGSDTAPRSRIATNVFDFDNPGVYHSSVPRGYLTLTKAN